MVMNFVDLPLQLIEFLIQVLPLGLLDLIMLLGDVGHNRLQRHQRLIVYIFLFTFLPLRLYLILPLLSLTVLLLDLLLSPLLLLALDYILASWLTLTSRFTRFTRLKLPWRIIGVPRLTGCTRLPGWSVWVPRLTWSTLLLGWCIGINRFLNLVDLILVILVGTLLILLLLNFRHVDAGYF